MWTKEELGKLREHQTSMLTVSEIAEIMQKDKRLVERSAGFSTTWITAAWRERKFFSFAEVRDAVAERLEVINTKPFLKRPGSAERLISQRKRNSCCRCRNAPMSPLYGNSRRSEMTI